MIHCRRVVELLEAQPAGELQQLRTFYTSCTEQKEGGQYLPGIEFLATELGRHLSPTQQDPDLTAVVGDLLQFSSTAILDIGLDIDPADNNRLLGVVR